MKTSFLALLCALVALAAPAADEQHHPPRPHALLDQLKSLEGTWETAGPEKSRTIYSVGANGSAIVEQLLPESAKMVNVIHADGEALMMTHYCASGNQPRYKATALTNGRIVFSFLDGTNLGAAYMAGVTLTMKDADHLTQEWISRDGGKDEIVTFEFTRVK